MTFIPRPRSLPAIALPLSLAALGCSEDPSAGEKFAEDYADLVCPALKTCCADTDLPASFDCHGTFAGRPVSGYDKAKGQACLDAVAATEDPCEKLSQPACTPVFGSEGDDTAQSGKAAGEACGDMFECGYPAGGDARCQPAQEGGSDVCVVLTRGSTGDACAESCTEEGGGFSCHGPYPLPPGTELARCYREDGIRCDETALKCVALSVAGNACDSTTHCVAGLVCGYAADAPAGAPPTCQMPRAPGESCATSSMSPDREVCGDGYCDEADLKCKAPAAVGDACDSTAFEDACAAGAFCDSETNKCVAEGGGGLICGLIGLAASGL